MTYLDAVNNVLRRLREEEVTTVQANTYSKMVGDFVNDAKDLVETAWDWAGLRNTLTVTTQEDVFSYVLTGSQSTIKLLDVINDTSNFFMEYRTATWFDNQYLNQTPVKGSPAFYTFNGVDSNGDSQVDLYPKPDGVYEIKFNSVLRNNNLSLDADKLFIPSAPVIHLAIALLSRERGETGGTSTPEYFAIADKYLADAVAMDAQKHPDENVWYTA